MELITRWSWTAGLAGLVLVVGAIGGWYVTGTLEGAPTWLLGSGGVLLLVYAGLDRERIGGAASTRAFSYSAGSSLLVLLVLGICIAAYSVARRNDQTWDWTGAQTHSLSNQSIQVASALEVDVQVTAFFRSNASGFRQFHDLMRRFEEVSDRLTVEFVDPLQEPLRASEAEIVGEHGTALFKAGDRVQRLEWEITEDEVVRALVQLQSGEDHRICWSVGHGEPDPEDEFSPEGLGGVRSMLEQLNYQVVRLNIAQQGVDRACEAVILAQPTVDLWPYEREALAAYLAEGGRVLILLEPREVPELSAELERYGVLVGQDVVIDLNLKNQLMGVSDPSMVVLSADDFAHHPVTRTLTAAVVLRIARSVRPVLDAPGLEVTTLIHTSPDAWGETDPGAEDIQPDEGLEVVGEVPVVLAIEIEDPGVLDVAAHEPPPEDGLDLIGAAGRSVPEDFTPVPGGRLVVMGDGDFATNAMVSWGNNRDLFLNAVAWLVEEEDQIGERPETGDTLEISGMGEALLCLVSVVIVPGLAIAVAAGTLLRRRYM